MPTTNPGDPEAPASSTGASPPPVSFSFAPARARVAAAAVPGCQHVLAAGQPCQDAVRAKLEPDRVLIAVSDGHGDPGYTHSDEGSRTAVAVAIDVLDNLADRLKDIPESVDTPALESEFADAIKRRIAFEWNRQVKNHAAMLASRDEGIAFDNHVTGDWTEGVKPYGCTLLAAMFTRDVALWLKLGDGEILAVTADGARRVFTANADAASPPFGQATYSLAMRAAVEHMQLRFDRAPTTLAVLTTDGVCDQYDTDPTFDEEWGTRMLARIQSNGWTATALDLPRYLATVARDGDDCSAALAWFAPEEGD
jgi:hypothetical protein